MKALLLIMMFTGFTESAMCRSVALLYADDQSLTAKANDIWFENGTIESHIQENAQSPKMFVDFVYHLATQVLKYNSLGDSFKAQRSLLADSLAIVVSRNFVQTTSGQTINIQPLLDAAELQKLSKHSQNKFYLDVVNALSYSNVSTQSFLQRFFKWSFQLDERTQARANQNLLHSNDIAAEKFWAMKAEAALGNSCIKLF